MGRTAKQKQTHIPWEIGPHCGGRTGILLYAYMSTVNCVEALPTAVRNVETHGNTDYIPGHKTMVLTCGSLLVVQPHGISPRENLIKECAEEAAIPHELAEAAAAVGAVSYRTLTPQGLKRDVLFVYDLPLPADFVPQPADGEVGCSIHQALC